jgi:hypothetical protein
MKIEKRSSRVVPSLAAGLGGVLAGRGARVSPDRG